MTDTIDDVRARWDAFADMFEARMERITEQLSRTLLLQLQLGEAEALLEVGAGAGGAALAARPWLKDGARHVVSDLSTNMVARARAKLPPEVEVQEANAEALPFGDGEFDRFLANLNLMITPDTDAHLREAARVLRPFGIASWSVWGRPENSNMFTVPAQAAEAVGITITPPPRSNFHLGDRDALRDRIARHGFDAPVAWYQTMAVPASSGQAYAEGVLSTPRWTAALESVESAQVDALRVELSRRIEEVLASGEPICLEALLVVARRSRP